MLNNIVQNHLDFIILICALFTERYLPLVRWYHPNTFLIAVFSAIGQRVYDATQHKSYQYLAASLASILTLSVILILCTLLLEFAFYPAFFNGLILYLCLEHSNVNKKAMRITKLLKQKQKSAARELLTPLVVREVKTLSCAGIVKAVIECLILKTARHYFVVIFIFLLLGPVAALTYRLMTLMQCAWRSHIKPSSDFLTPLKVTIFIIEFIPIRLMAITIALIKSSKKSMHLIKHYGRHFYQTNTGWLLSVCAATLGVQLGGPAIYFGERFEKMRIGVDRLPTADDIPKLITCLRQASFFWLLVIVGIEIIKMI